eukprot:TRINITY_DN25897_c1_g6_i1.p1 TRINITY_DN25897_c1_g6~~TRINITY_DN25897_c1_g6_i1.p1  ORF type:complete len:624 (+),score=82.93 TRINITY_DN25897_c1_g6_i1:90-1961(+)
MSWELPSLPSPFGFAYETYRHGEPAWDALFVHPEGPFLPTCEDDDWHRGTFKTSRMVYWLSWYLAVDIITVLLCFVAHALPYLLRCCPQNSYRQLAAVDAEELIERGGTSDVAAQKEKTAVEFRDHGAMFEKGGVLDGAFPILHLLYHAFCIAIVCVGWNQDALCLDFGLDWELWAVWQLGMSLSYILQALVRNWSGSMKSHLSVLSLRQSRQQDGISWTKWFGEKVLTIGQEVTSDARQVIAWNEDWPQGFLGLFFAWHRRDVGGFASFSAALSFAKGLGIPLLRKTLIYVKDFLFELHVQEVTTEIVESCMNVWLEKFQSSHTVDVCAEAAIKLEQLTNKEELRRRFEDFLSEDLVIFKDIKAAAEEACETVIANAASVKLIERVRLRLQETTQAMARELSEQCTSTWTEKLCSPDGTSAIQRHAGAQVDAFTEAEKTLIELTNKERLQKELTKFLYTEHEMFNEIVVIATQACESGIRVEVEESMISMATSKLEATTKNLVTEVCEACMDAWTQKLLPTDEAAHAMFKKMQDKHTVQKTDKLDYTVELEGFPTEKFRTLTNKETLQTKLAAFQDTQSVLFSPISKLARQACETGIKDKSRSSMSDKMRELLAAKATGLLG